MLDVVNIQPDFGAFRAILLNDFLSKNDMSVSVLEILKMNQGCYRCKSETCSNCSFQSKTENSLTDIEAAIVVSSLRLKTV